MSIRSLFCALSVALLCGCSSHYTWKASIPLTQTATEACLEQALEQEPGVFDLVRTGEKRFAFRVELPDVDRDDSPSFALSEVYRDGPVMALSTVYDAGIFEPSSDTQLDRARDLAAGIAERCTGRRPTLGPARVCGAGEERDLCVSAEE